MDINWLNIRPIDGSQQLGFEELCCQLARHEVPEEARFIRKGSHDAGVECYAIFPDGQEWGWQTKYFTESPGASQWQQVDNSVKTAIEKHPNLTRYTVCMPIDRPDARRPNQKSCMEKWDDHVEKWSAWAQERGMQVELDYWGSSELIDLLSKLEHGGRTLFWFGHHSFTPDWFRQRVREEVANADRRYTPDLHYPLPIAGIFDGLARSEGFYDELRGLCDRVVHSYEEVASERLTEHVGDQLESIATAISSLSQAIAVIDEGDMKPVDHASILASVKKARDSITQCRRRMEHYGETRRREGYPRIRIFHPEIDHLHDIMDSLDAIDQFCCSEKAKLSNTPALLFVGDAGTGKTHMFCRAAEERTKRGLPTILVLGEHFTSASDPWDQILSLLGLDCERDAFLGALNAAGEANRCRTLILIDALNESQDPSKWKSHLSGMLKALEPYPWVGIAVSVRSCYEERAIPPSLSAEQIVRIEHHGFAGHEEEAIEAIFSKAGIVHPGVPALYPVFHNPALLMLVVEGAKNRKQKSLPPVIEGITSVIDYYIDSVNDRLAVSLDFDPEANLIRCGLLSLAELMVEQDSEWLTREEARRALDTVHPSAGFEKSPFNQLISEGLLTEVNAPVGPGGQRCNRVRLSYQLLSDHLIAEYLMDRYVDAGEPSRAFDEGGPLRQLVADKDACWCNRGVIEALSIQAPERLNLELFELAPHCAGFGPIREAFIESIVWRHPQACRRDETLDYIRKQVLPDSGACSRFLEALVTVAPNPEHPYNAGFLHKSLMQYELPDRDAFWSTFVHEQGMVEGPACRLVKWAWSDKDRSSVPDDTLRLWGTTLAWFLTTPNRFVRDGAAKGLVSLFTNRLPLLQQMLEAFTDVNDPYVSERLFSAAYGCVMRNSNDGLKELALWVYRQVFEDRHPPAHVLLRDYARGIIELAASRGLDLDIDIERICPPYESEWTGDVTSVGESEAPNLSGEAITDERRAFWHLYHSVMDHGDFSRYIIPRGVDKISRSRLRSDQPVPSTPKERHDSFVQSLDPAEREAWDRYIRIGNHKSLEQLLSFMRQHKRGEDSYPPQQHTEEDATAAEHDLRQVLSGEKLIEFESFVLPYLDRDMVDDPGFDISVERRWILSRVLELGWTAERFGSFDARVSSYGYDSSRTCKPERMGKKYQWIAYHELLARLTDNFVFTGDDPAGTREPYVGPWQFDARDIDSSCLIRRTQRQPWQAHGNTWLCPAPVDIWDSPADNADWLRDSTDLPDVRTLLELTGPEDESHWLNLRSHYMWEAPSELDEHGIDMPRRRIDYWIRSFIVRKSGSERFRSWADEYKPQDTIVPEDTNMYSTFMGEMFWSPAHRYHRPKLPSSNSPEVELIAPDDRYLWESGVYDCSVTETIAICTPSKWLVDYLGLVWQGTEGQYRSREGQLVALDPSVCHPGSGSLLVNRDILLACLEDEGCELFWIVSGEKNISGRGDYKGRLRAEGVYSIDREEVTGSLFGK